MKLGGGSGMSCLDFKVCVNPVYVNASEFSNHLTSPLNARKLRYREGVALCYHSRAKRIFGSLRNSVKDDAR